MDKIDKLFEYCNDTLTSSDTSDINRQLVKDLVDSVKSISREPEETIAIGDNFNDLSMIKVAGLGVGVQNTAEGMKKECDYITSATCNENAVAEVIHKYILKDLK